MSDLTQECRQLLDVIAQEKESLNNDTFPKKIMNEMTEIENSVRRIWEEISQPSRLGLVGQVSAGKTRMLETLLGCVGSILSENVGPGATTGNIVEYTITCGDMKSTTFDSWKVQIMDRDRIAALFEEYFRKIENTINKNDDEHQQFLVSLQDIMNQKDSISENDYWNDIDRWAIDVYNKARFKTLNPIVLEMHRIAGTAAAASVWLGKELSVSEKQAFSVMTLSNNHSAPQSLEKQLFNNIPDFGTPIEEIKPDVFRIFFPIIHKIRVNVRVPAEIFKMYEKYGNSLQVIDCPGYGASGSSVRDQTLCFIELDDIDSILVLLDSKNPGQETKYFEDAQRKWGQVAREKTVVVLNKFDLLQISQDSNVAEAFKQLRQKEKIEEEELLQVLASPLQQPYTYALEHVAGKNPEKLVFFSSSAFIGKKYHAFKPIMYAQREWLDKNCPNDSYEGLKECELWQSVVQCMSDTSPLSALLRDFAEDGGGARLVKTFGEHLIHFGNNNQQTRLHEDIERQKRKWENFKKRLEEEKQSVLTASQDLKECGECKLTFRQMKEILDKFKLLMETICRDTSKLVKTFESELFYAKNYYNTNVIDEIGQWPIWEALFRTISDTTNYCVPIQSNEKQYVDEEMRIPDTTDAFEERFTNVLQSELENIMTETLPGIILYAFEEYGIEQKKTWGDEQFQKLKKTFENISSAIPEEFKSLPFNLLDSWLESPSIATMNVLFPIHEKIEKDIRSDYNLTNTGTKNKMEDNKDNTGYSKYYPLQHGEKPRYFAWSSRVQEKVGSHNPPAPNHRHLAAVIQIRQAFFEGSVFFIESVFDEIKFRFLNSFTKQCLDLKDNVGILERKFEEHQPTGTKTPINGPYIPGRHH